MRGCDVTNVELSDPELDAVVQAAELALGAVTRLRHVAHEMNERNLGNLQAGNGMYAAADAILDGTMTALEMVYRADPERLRRLRDERMEAGA